MINLIAAIGKNNELGRDGELCFRIKDDMKFFKETTMGHKVIMGRKTWESLPGKLPGRENIVISRHDVAGADKVFHSARELIDLYELDGPRSGEEVFVIGGGMVYTEFLPFADTLYLTEVEAECKEADSFFPKFDRARYNKFEIKKGEENGLKYSINQYDAIKDGK